MGWFDCGGSLTPSGYRPRQEEPQDGDNSVEALDASGNGNAVQDAGTINPGDVDYFPAELPAATQQTDTSQGPETIIVKQVPWDKMAVDPVVIIGELQQLAAGVYQKQDGITVKGCYAVSNEPGQYKKLPQLTLSFINGSSGEITPLGKITNAFDPLTGTARFQVSSLFQNNAGNLVFALQSTGGFPNLDGSVQQLLVTDQEGGTLSQYDFLASVTPNYRPQVVVQDALSGEQFVLLNNCDPDAAFIKGNFYTSCTKNSAVAVFQTADFSDQPIIFPLAGVINGGAATLVNGHLIIAAAGNVHIDPKSTGKLLSLDTVDLGKPSSSTAEIELPGIGLGSTQISVQNGGILFTVNNSSWAPELAKPAVVLLKNQQTFALSLPEKLTYVAGAVFAGDEDVVFNGSFYKAGAGPMDPPVVTTGSYRNSLAGWESVSLQDKVLPAQFAVGVVKYDESSFCYGAVGTEEKYDDSGAVPAKVVYSTVMLVHP